VRFLRLLRVRTLFCGGSSSEATSFFGAAGAKRGGRPLLRLGATLFGAAGEGTSDSGASTFGPAGKEGAIGAISARAAGEGIPALLGLFLELGSTLFSLLFFNFIRFSLRIWACLHLLNCNNNNR